VNSFTKASHQNKTVCDIEYVHTISIEISSVTLPQVKLPKHEARIGMTEGHGQNPIGGQQWHKIAEARICSWVGLEGSG
jgi:hypothetical protein